MALRDRLAVLGSTAWGRTTIVAIAILSLIGGVYYLNPYFGIPILLITGLALPIYSGWKRPRSLALIGLVAMLIASPLISVLYANEYRAPSPVASSVSSLPYGNGGSVFDNAKVTPFTGNGGGTYHFTVSIHTNFVPPNDSAIQWLVLWVSTCPGAISANDSNCGGGGYPYYTQNHSFVNQTVPSSYTFNQSLPGSNIWWWVMAGVVKNSSGSYVWIFLFESNGQYAWIEGPVTGDFLSTVGLFVPVIYETVFVYVGLVFYAALLFYMFLKGRERTRKAASQMPPPLAGPSAPGSSDAPAPSSGTPPTPKAAGAAAAEKECPNCKAVVYPNETTCWKCGASLTTGAAAPLPSGTS